MQFFQKVMWMRAIYELSSEFAKNHSIKIKKYEIYDYICN